MSIPTMSCSRCGKDFELYPDKPGYANLCPECSLPAEALRTKAVEDAKLHSAKAAASRLSSQKLQQQHTKKRLKLRRLLQRGKIEPKEIIQIIESADEDERPTLVDEVTNAAKKMGEIINAAKK